MSTLELIEILARGGTAGLCLVLAIQFMPLRHGNWAARLGGLFMLATAAYAIVSSETLSTAFHPASIGLSAPAIPMLAIFWWFILALFDDDFQWHPLHAAPAVIILSFAIAHFQFDEGSSGAVISLMAWQVTGLGLLIHVGFIALRDLGDDLVEPRRRFRLALAITVGVMGVGVAGVEMVYAHAPMPDLIFRLHGVMVFALTLVFSNWALQARPELFLQPERSSETDRTGEGARRQVRPEDRGLARRLSAWVETGGYRQAGLSVSQLARALDTPEHRLRLLINSGLGYRNFSDFLNTHRLADARKTLADPDRAHDQILTLALELGYGSIAPFNRAFKAATGQTPTAWRRDALTRTGAQDAKLKNPDQI